jgi:hypothetical protein
MDPRPQLGDAGLDRFAALALAHGVTVRQCLGGVRGPRWFQAALGKFVRHPKPMEVDLGRLLFRLCEEDVADGDKCVDFLGHGVVP